MEHENLSSYLQFAGAAIGSVVAIVVARIQFGNKKKEVKTVEEALFRVRQELKEVKSALKTERIARGIVEGKFENLKYAFKVAFNQYEKEFTDDPDQMGMLKDLREIIED